MRDVACIEPQIAAMFCPQQRGRPTHQRLRALASGASDAYICPSAPTAPAAMRLRSAYVYICMVCVGVLVCICIYIYIYSVCVLRVYM